MYPHSQTLSAEVTRALEERDRYKTALREIVRKWPTTGAAHEAAFALDNIVRPDPLDMSGGVDMTQFR